MRKRLIFGIIAGILLLSIGLTGCQEGGGIATDVFDTVKDQLEAAQKQIQELQKAGDVVTDVKDTVEGVAERVAGLEDQIAGLQDEKAALQAEIDSLIDQYVLEGDTVAATVGKVARYYHETHVYSTWDMFVCSDMASEIWNMLKAKGIPSVMAVGSINRPVTDIVNSDHAWVLAEVAPGQYLAVETTAGVVFLESEKPRYYRGWYFETPAEIDNYNTWIREYNVRVGTRNMMAEEVNEALDLYNTHFDSANYTEADKYLLLYNKLVELKESEEAALNALIVKINNLATPL